MGGTLTVEQVLDAIFNGSSYASYDGVKYYASGIDMRAIADELNAAIMSEYIYATDGWRRWTGEEIVRCRDCAYILHRKYNNGFEYQTCSYFDSEHAEVEPNGFCAWGVRRNQDEDNG